MDLPPSFVAAVTGAWPDGGPAFLARLPSLIRSCEQRWDLRLFEPFPLSYNYVAPGILTDGREVVVKLGVPNPELTTEIEALRRYDGRGAVRLIEADAGLGVLLMERVRPGSPLAELRDDDEATVIAAEVMRRLWQPLPAQHPFPELRRWTRALRQYASRYPGSNRPLPRKMVDKAVGRLDELLVQPPESVLIHGDFHHWNVLRANREPWLAIDPKGVAAERAFDVGPLFYNPVPDVFGWPDLQRVTRRRLDLLSEQLGLDRQRLTACAFVAAVLSACWSIEDGDDGAPPVLLIAGILDEV
ncbi:MAG: aminoglycoside phosphotransferase family protein [Nitrososphaerales archaeon]